MSESRRPVSSNGGYLSIREVLDSLIDEFDDITISKIRFLESRGLIHPERTPSGYRKFFPADVERLRWILRQQRENFLPLKVIKRRLDVEDGLPADLPESQSLFEDHHEREDRDLALATVVSNIRQARRAGGEHGAPGADEGPEPSGPDEREAQAEAATLPTTYEQPASEPVVVRDPVAPQAEPDVDTPAPAAKLDTPQEPVASRSGDGGEGRLDELVGVSLSTEELAAATSTNVEAIRELEDFGFISSQSVGGVPCFDGEALLISKAIVGLRAFGLEPRHLKLVRNAAERDASLYAQVVAPLLRQRNPEARDRARRQLEELANKGASLYEQILRLEIRRFSGS